MKKVAFLNNWGDSLDNQLERYNYQTPNDDGVWENLQGSTNLDKADYTIIMDGFPEEVDPSSIPDKNQLYFQREPLDIKDIEFSNENALFTGTYENHYHLATWQIRKSFQELANLKPPKKTKKLSSIMSAKRNTPGQNQRFLLLKHIRSALPSVEIFGRNLSRKDFGESYQGELNYNLYCKFKGLINYEYSIAFENSSHENYFTEKLIDCFLTWTKPIYWGCSNVFDYFPKDALAWVDIFGSEAVSHVLEELQKPVDYNAIREARELVLYQYNLWPSILKLIKKRGEIS